MEHAATRLERQSDPSAYLLHTATPHASFHKQGPSRFPSLYDRHTAAYPYPFGNKRPTRKRNPPFFRENVPLGGHKEKTHTQNEDPAEKQPKSHCTQRTPLCLSPCPANTRPLPEAGVSDPGGPVSCPAALKPIHTPQGTNIPSSSLVSKKTSSTHHRRRGVQSAPYRPFSYATPLHRTEVKLPYDRAKRGQRRRSVPPPHPPQAAP